MDPNFFEWRNEVINWMKWIAIWNVEFRFPFFPSSLNFLMFRRRRDMWSEREGSECVEFKRKDARLSAPSSSSSKLTLILDRLFLFPFTTHSCNCLCDDITVERVNEEAFVALLDIILKTRSSLKARIRAKHFLRRDRAWATSQFWLQLTEIFRDWQNSWNSRTHPTLLYLPHIFFLLKTFFLPSRIVVFAKEEKSKKSFCWAVIW